MIDVVIQEGDGITPHFAFCQRCGVSKEIARLEVEIVSVCSCGAYNYGKAQGSPCGLCGEVLVGVSRSLGLDERVASPSLCGRCQELEKRESELVAQGGVFYRCSECGRGGVMMPESGLLVRERIDKERFGVKEDGTYPDCGVEFVQCSQHGKLPGDR